MSVHSFPSFLTEKEVAQMLRIAPSSLRAIRARQEITFHRIGKEFAGRVVYSQEDVQRFIERNRRVAATEAA
jgi:ribosome-associated toxin RatA of RatAB toxin-antitoxin module